MPGRSFGRFVGVLSVVSLSACSEGDAVESR